MMGCATDNRRGIDPLLGGGPRTGGSAAARDAPASPLPAVGAPSTPAALAAVFPPPPDPRSGLRIGEAPAAGTGPRAPLLRQPEPNARLTGAMPGTPRVTTYEQAQVLLLTHGVRWQRLEMVGEPGEWKFSCSLPSRQNVHHSRTYEARAPSYLAAVQAVLEQMEKDDSGR